MPLAPYSGYVTLLFLAAVFALMLFDPEYGTWIRAAVLIGAPALVIGWYLVRGRVMAAATPAPADPEKPPAVMAPAETDEQ
jgi:L-asparagine permease